MKTFDLKGEIRNDFGKKAARAYRREGLIPCVVYGGHNEENVNFVVKSGDVRNLIYTPEIYLVNLDLGEKKMQAALREIQFHPVKDTILHIDFLHVFEDVPPIFSTVNIEVNYQLQIKCHRNHKDTIFYFFRIVSIRDII
jgi:large subunit ribosomal protein L25